MSFWHANHPDGKAIRIHLVCRNRNRLRINCTYKVFTVIYTKSSNTLKYIEKIYSYPNITQHKVFIQLFAADENQLTIHNLMFFAGMDFEEHRRAKGKV
jgi:hypothetical protein